MDSYTIESPDLPQLAAGTHTLYVTRKSTNQPELASPSVTTPLLSLHQDALTIADPGPLTYATTGFTLRTVGGSGTGAVSYSVPPTTGSLDVSEDGAANILGPGTVTVTAIKAADLQYIEASTDLAITVSPAVFAGSLTPVVTGTVQVGCTLTALPTAAAATGLAPTPGALTTSGMPGIQQSAERPAHVSW